MASLLSKTAFVGAVLAILALAGTASAYVNIGNTGCELHDYNHSKFIGSDWNFHAESEVTCAANQTINVRTCTQQLVTGGWQNVVYKGETTCENEPASGTGFGTDADVNTIYVPMKCERYYRTWGKGTANGQTATYVIPGDHVPSGSGCL